MSRKRNPVEPGEFEDPLSNYDPPQYSDELQRVLCDEELTRVRITPVHSVPPDMKVDDVLELMWQKESSSVVVTDADNKPVGIFTSKDVLYKIAGNDDLRDKPISAVMTPDPCVLYVTESPAKALNLMAVGGFRHIPVLDQDDRVVGMLAPRRTTAFLQENMG